jgi:Erv1 / Alr family
MGSRSIPVFGVIVIVCFFGIGEYFASKHSNTIAQEDNFINGTKVTKAAIGAATWQLLHTISIKYPLTPSQNDKESIRMLLKNLAMHFPCEECSYHFLSYLEEHSPSVDSRNEFVMYLCNMHNEINKFLSKPVFDCNTYYDVWGGDCGCTVRREQP